MLFRLSLLICAALASGCTWVKMSPDGASVRVASAREDLSACQRRGEIGVTVEDQVAFYKRSSIKVRDELETLARNEAVSLGADTVQPKTEPRDGEQRFIAYTCGPQTAARVAAPTRPAAQAEGEDKVQTFPLDE
jgi:hypothetical protein